MYERSKLRYGNPELRDFKAFISSIRHFFDLQNKHNITLGRHPFIFVFQYEPGQLVSIVTGYGLNGQDSITRGGPEQLR
jgi:hypothetical protein